MQNRWTYLSWTLFFVALAVLFSIVVWAFDHKKVMGLKQQGDKRLAGSQFPEALDAFKRMRNACEGDTYCTGVALFYQGRCYLEMAQYDDAMNVLLETKKIFSDLHKPIETAKVVHLMGRVYAARTDFAKALEAYDQVQAVLTQPNTRDDSELFWLLGNRAQAYIELSRFDDALKDLDSAELLLKQRKDPARRAGINYLRGQIAAKQQNYDEAMKHYNTAIQLYGEIGDQKKIQSLLSYMGLIMEHQSRYAHAMQKYRESLKLAQRLKDPDEQATVLNNLGSVNWKRGNYEQAVRFYKQALKIRKDLGRRLFYAQTLNNLGIVYVAYGNYAQAFELFGEAYHLAKEIGSPAMEAWTLHDMAWVFKDQGKLKESEQFSTQAVAIAKQVNDRRMLSIAVLRLGNLYEYYGDFDKAQEQYEHAAKVQTEIGNKLYLSNTFIDIGNVLTRKGDASEAEKRFQAALRIKRKIGAPLGESLCKFALFYIEKGHYVSAGGREPQADRETDLRRAEAYIRQAYEVIGPEDKNDLMLFTYVQGRLLLEEDPTQSISAFEKLKVLSEASGSMKYSFLAYVGLGLAYERLKKWSEAEVAFERAVQYAENIRKTLDPVKKRTFLHGEEILGVKHVLPYEGLARVRWLKGDQARSLEAAEFTKARAFADKIARRIPGITFGVDVKFLTELEEIEQHIRANHQQMRECRSKGGDESLIPKLARTGDRLAARLAAVEQKIRLKYPAFHAVRFPRPMSIEQSGLRDDELALAYEVTDSGILIYLVKGKQMIASLFKPITRRNLDALIRRFREPFEDLSDANLREKLASFDLHAGKELYDLLLGDVLPKVEEGKPLILMPDDSLAVLPFEMLVAGDGGQIDTGGDIPRTKGVKFFADRNPISYYQSVTALTLARGLAKQKESHAKLLVIANPVTGYEVQDGSDADSMSKDRRTEIDALAKRMEGEGRSKQGKIVEQKLLSADTFKGLLSFGPLPQTKELADEIRQSYGSLADVYSGKDATMATFRKEIVPKIGSYGKIVFATHGYFGDGFLPEIQEPILLFSLIPPRVDNLLRMSMVMDLDLSADLVALIACQSGLGKRISGEGTMGMGRAFQYAGAKSVLMSMWMVDAEASVRMVRSLLTHMRNGSTKQEALGLAREEIRRSGRDHPFFWASFILVGGES